MEYQNHATILQGVGGRYTLRLDGPPDSQHPLGGRQVICRAKGSFRHAGLTPLPGDRVTVTYDDSSFSRSGGGPDSLPEGTEECIPSPDGTGIRIQDILPRKNVLIRPPMANLDVMFVTMACASPEPLLPTFDRLIAIAEHHHTEPVILVTKADLDPARANALSDLYRQAGFQVFTVSCTTGAGIGDVRQYIHSALPGKTAAFAGTSGVGKSTLLNHLFPSLARLTGSISKKNERGRHTTREITLFPLGELLDGHAAANDGFLADTPGFSLLDFVRFDFFGKEDLPDTMRDFRPYLGQCRYQDCTHTKEEGCAVLAAVRRGELARSRHESYLSMYADLKDKHPWDRKK